MDQSKIFLIFTEPLESAGFEYMATGSVASMVYGMLAVSGDLIEHNLLMRWIVELNLTPQWEIINPVKR